MSLAVVSMSLVLSRISVRVLCEIIFLSLRHAPSSGAYLAVRWRGASDCTSTRTSSDKSIEGCSGEVTIHQVACHFRVLHSCGTHEKSTMDCSLTQVEKDMNALTPVEATRRCADEKGCPDICFTEQGSRLEDPHRPLENLLS